MVGHGDTFTVGKGQDLVIVEHSVQIFNPNGIDRAVAGEPDVEFGGPGVALLPKGGEDTRNPII